MGQRDGTKIRGEKTGVLLFRASLRSKRCFDEIILRPIDRFHETILLHADSLQMERL